MIVDKNINPERDLYYLGGILIDVLASKNNVDIDYIDLYQSLNQKQEISINLYLPLRYSSSKSKVILSFLSVVLNKAKYVFEDFSSLATQAILPLSLNTCLLSKEY